MADAQVMDKSLYDDVDVSLNSLGRFDELELGRKTWESEAKEIATYVFPRRSIFEDTDGQFRRVGEELYDGTAVRANNTLANGLMGHLVTEGNPWFKLGLPWQDAMEVPGVGGWLDICERVLYDDYHRSNFYEQCQEIFCDVGGIGNACLYTDEDAEGVLWYQSIHPYEFYFDVDEKNRIDTVYRRFFLTVRQLYQQFGKEGLDEKVLILAKEGKLSTRLEVIHACEPRMLREPDNPSSKNKKWKSEYWDRSNKHLMSESGYDRFPYMPLRWATNSGEVYGRGPGSDALVAIKRANLINKDLLTAAQKHNFPPAILPETMRNRFNDDPKGRILTRPGEEKPEYLRYPGNYPVGIDREQDVREIIKESFMVDMFLMLNQMRDTNKTATEILEMQSEKAAILGTAVGRVASEFLDPVINDAFDRARAGGRVPPPPLALLQWMQMNKVGKGHLRVEYIGPLAQALKRFHATHGTIQGLNAVLPYAQIWPDIRDNFDSDQLSRDVYESYGGAARFVKDPKQVAAARQARMKAEQEAAKMQQAAMSADAYQKTTKAPEAGSPLEKAMEKAQ